MEEEVAAQLVSSNQLHHLNKWLDVYLKSYHNIKIKGDLNLEFFKRKSIKVCKSVWMIFAILAVILISDPTRFKNPNNTSCKAFFLTNWPQCFQKTCGLGTGIFDFHKMVATVMKIDDKAQKPKTINTEITNIFRNNLLILS